MAKKRLYWSPARIKQLRLRLKLTQKEAAEKVGLTRRQWAGWEAGTSKPSGPALILLKLLDDGKI